MIRRLISSGLGLGLSRTARSLYWVFSGNAVSIVLAFFATVLIARYLTKEEFGVYLALFTFANLVADLGEVGIGASLVSFIPGLLLEKKEIKVRLFLSTAFYIELAIGVILSIITLIFSPLMSKFLFGNTSPLHITITATMMIGLVLFNFSLFSLSAYKKFPQTATINIFYGLVRFLLLFVIVLFSQLTLTKVLFVFMLAPFMGWLYSFVHLGTSFLIPTLDKSTAKTLFRFSSFLSLQKIFISVSSRLDMLMLLPLAGSYAAGVYGVGSRIAQVYPFVVGSFAQVLAPKFAEFVKGKQAIKFFQKAFLVALTLLLSIFILYIFANQLILLLFPKYTESIPVFRGLLVAMIGFIAAVPFTTFLVYTLKKPYIMTISALVQLVIIIISNFIFIPRLGSLGPVVGIGLGNVAVLAISVVATWYYLKTEK